MTDITGSQTDVAFYSLTPLTCYEVIDKLTDVQLDRELMLIVDADSRKHLDTLEKKQRMLLGHFYAIIRLQNDHLTDHPPQDCVQD